MGSKMESLAGSRKETSCDTTKPKAQQRMTSGGEEAVTGPENWDELGDYEWSLRVTSGETGASA
jgi:hypothetical protein